MLYGLFLGVGDKFLPFGYSVVASPDFLDL